MNKTSISLLRTIRETDESLSFVDKAVLEDLIAGRISMKASGGREVLLLTQKDAAKMLGVSRGTLWKMKKDGILSSVEILPNTYRYRLEDIEFLAQKNL